MKSQGIIFSVRKASRKMIGLSGFAGIVVLISGFQCFFIIHLANLWSVKIVQKSVKVREKSRNFSASDEWQSCYLFLPRS